MEKSDHIYVQVQDLSGTVWLEGFLYKVVPPELKISPIMYFVIHNSIQNTFCCSLPYFYIYPDHYYTLFRNKGYMLDEMP